MLEKKNYDFYILTGIYSKGFKGLDFAKYGVSCMLLHSAGFKKILKQIDQGKEMLDEVLKETNKHGWEKITYVFFSQDKAQLEKAYQFLLLLQPSKMQLMADFITQYNDYEINGGRIQEHQVVTVGLYDHSVFHFKDRYSKDEKRNLFFLGSKEQSRANKVLEQFMTVSDPDAFSRLFGVYLEACAEKRTYVKFLLLVMFIESLVVDDDTIGVGYKLARMAGVLVGDNAADSKEIFDRVKKSYAIRSKLVHSAKNEIHTGNYLLFIHSVVSEILITIILNKKDTTDLFRKTTAMAFGSRVEFWRDHKFRNIYNFFANEMNFLLDLKFKKQ